MIKDRRFLAEKEETAAAAVIASSGKGLNGEIKPREKSPVPSILDTANGMIGLYNSIL